MTVLLGVAGCMSTRNVVDGKAIVEVPLENGGTATCYLLEINREDGSEEAAEDYFCVSRQEYDRNSIDQPWVDANGREK